MSRQQRGFNSRWPRQNFMDLTFNLAKAIADAASAHSEQVDKAGKAYILHPLRVMFMMDTEEEMIVAVLHDTVEDTDLTLKNVYTHYGSVVGDAVDALSRRDGESYTDYIYRVRENALARKVKLADLRDNTSPARIAALPALEQKISQRYKQALEILT